MKDRKEIGTGGKRKRKKVRGKLAWIVSISTFCQRCFGSLMITTNLEVIIYFSSVPFF